MPEERCQAEMWPHPARLPLGAGYQGCCTAPDHAGERPSEDELRQFCNLGYARSCSRFPGNGAAHAVRFHARRIEPNGIIALQYACERDYLPLESGVLKYDSATATWSARHVDARIQRMAECYLEAYLAQWRGK